MVREQVLLGKEALEEDQAGRGPGAGCAGVFCSWQGGPCSRGCVSQGQVPGDVASVQGSSATFLQPLQAF